MQNGRIFIDRSSELFEWVLAFLRGELTLPSDTALLKRLQAEADFFQIPRLIEHIRVAAVQIATIVISNSANSIVWKRTVPRSIIDEAGANGLLTMVNRCSCAPDCPVYKSFVPSADMANATMFLIDYLIYGYDTALSVNEHIVGTANVPSLLKSALALARHGFCREQIEFLHKKVGGYQPRPTS